MRNSIRNAYFLALATTALTVIMDPNQSTENQRQLPPEHFQSEDPRSFNDALRTCFAKRSYGTWECMNRGALSALQSWNDDDCLDFGDVKLERSEGQSRDILDLDWDPKDFGNVVKAASRLLERRNMKWDLGNIYPGLQMRVGPTLSAGSGMLEFVMDERSSHYHNRQVGTGRLLMRQLVLPFLLGFKFNLASLLPLLFGMLIIITKKALLLTKVALFIAGLLGWNSLFSGFQGSSGYFGANNGFSRFGGGAGAQANYGYGYGQGPQLGLGGAAVGGLNPGLLQDQNPAFQPYRGLSADGFPFGQHVIREIVNVYESATNQEGEENDRRKKNFVWTRSDA
ncbi:hypothetical protein TSAR_003502 [Trichomalopsis sarcophagae]|uniref:Osiris 10 n=1 Tax=Trichomalopsis sarcophagae TaxID=543379 RepID=A0A232F351_9HYME|nr:hypothetical protein TSAR_003502 [Trichomalopsis sarcophagae]